MQPTIYNESDLSLDLSLLDRDAIQVILRLRRAGFTTYLVGGSVRDLLLHRAPKDFDISTSARPEEIKRLFGRQCILIGRRFRLAHIRYGHKIFEVSTFRAGEMTEDLITQDNVWGSEADDVGRRDFTINGLLYDPEHHKVIDYVGGWEDLHHHLLRTIGDPEVRFKQDPVRMIRLLKFQARFGFQVAPETSSALSRCLAEISKSSQARVLEEFLRMLESCAAAPFFQLLIDSGMGELVLPNLHGHLKGPLGKEILLYLEGIDKANKQAQRFPIERPVLTAALLFPLLEKEITAQLSPDSRPPSAADILNSSNHLIRSILLSAFSHFPRRISALTSYVLCTQYRLTPLTQKRSHPIRLFQFREFPLALRLLKIRAHVNPLLQKTYVTWREHYRHFLRQEDPNTYSRGPHVSH